MTSLPVWKRLPGDEFEQLGIDPKEYAKSYLEGFDYKIGDVTVDEDKGHCDRRGYHHLQVHE